MKLEAIHTLEEGLLNPKFFLMKGNEFLLDVKTKNPIWFNTEKEAKGKAGSTYKAVELSTISNPQGYKKRRPASSEYRSGKWLKKQELKATPKTTPKTTPKRLPQKASREAEKPKEDTKFNAFVEAVKRDVTQAIALNEISKDTFEVLDYIKTNYRADTPSDIYEKMVDAVYNWYKSKR